MRLILIVIILLITPCFGAEDVYQFKNAKQQQQFDLLTNQFRCLVCQNQTIAESNAALASDLRDQIYEKIKQGENNQAIIHYLTERYGAYIDYRPPFNYSTLGLWFGPFLFLGIGLVYLFFYLHKRRD